jgi:hypothetical protein
MKRIACARSVPLLKVALSGKRRPTRLKRLSSSGLKVAGSPLITLVADWELAFTSHSVLMSSPSDRGPAIR